MKGPFDGSRYTFLCLFGLFKDVDFAERSVFDVHVGGFTTGTIEPFESHCFLPMHKEEY